MTKTKLTKRDAVALFKEECDGSSLSKDKPALRFAWGCYTDALCKDGYITMKQYETWQTPSFCN